MQPNKIREEYEIYLFVFEKTFSPITKYDINTIESYLSEISPSHMKTIEIYYPSMLETELTTSIIKRLFSLEVISLPKVIQNVLKINTDLFLLKNINQASVNLEVNDLNFSIRELECITSYYTETPLINFSTEYSEISSHIPSALHWNSEESLLRYSPDVPGVSSPMLIILKNSLTCVGGPSYNSLTGVYLIMQGLCEW